MKKLFILALILIGLVQCAKEKNVDENFQFESISDEQEHQMGRLTD